MKTPSQFFANAFSVAFLDESAGAQGQTFRHVDLSVLPVASGADAPRVIGLFTVKDVETSAYASVLMLEGAGGEPLRIEISTRGAAAPSVAPGLKVNGTRVGTGTVLTAAGEAIAFIPNALGRAMLHRI